MNKKQKFYSVTENRALLKTNSIINDKESLIFKQMQSFNHEMQRLSRIESSVNNNEQLKNVYQREFKRALNGLPFYAYRSEIIEKLQTEDILIIIGETGSGKTTQVPQYLLEAGLFGKKKICCTQPRKLAAISVAERIAFELECAEDSNLIYCKANNKDPTKQIKYHQIKMIFQTDQALLTEFKRDNNLSKYNIIIIDEAHERTIYTDILLSQLKLLVNKRKLTVNPLKLIIMSATLDEQKFSAYFNNCSIIKVPGRTYPIKIFYENCLKSDYLEQTFQKLKNIMKNNKDNQHKNNDILVFLPAVDDLNKASKQLTKYLESEHLNDKYIVMILHGRLESSEQANVFKEYANKIKIIFSTDVAETSITINGVSVIVDSGRVKERVYDQDRNISVLKLSLISQSSAEQRKGRAGRCCPGICHRLYSEKDYENNMAPCVQPDIFKIHLGIICLQLISAGIKDLPNCDLIDKPDNELVAKSIRKLESLNLITTNNNELTEAGWIAASLYLEPSQSRMIYEGLKLGCARSMIKIVAMMSVSTSLYVNKGNNSDETQLSQLSTSEKEGDLISMLNIYEKFEKIHNFKEKKQFCEHNKYSFKSLNIAKRSNDDLFYMLKSYIKSSKDPSLLLNSLIEKKQNLINKNDLILQCICSGLHENLAYFNGKLNDKKSKVLNVYKINHLNQEAFIDFESALNVLGDSDFDYKFLLFSDLKRNEKLFMRNLTPIRLEMLKIKQKIKSNKNTNFLRLNKILHSLRNNLLVKIII